MNPVAKPPPRSPEALLEAARAHDELKYDVEAGLARHHAVMQSGATLPDWSSAASGASGSAAVVPVVVKSLVAAVLTGASVATWYALRPAPAEPSAASAPAALVAASAPQHVSAPTAREQPEAASATTVPAASVEEKGATSPTRAARAQPTHEGSARSLVERESAPKAAHATSEDRDSPRPSAVERAETFDIVPALQPTPKPKDPSAMAEMSELAAAEKLLASAPARALAQVRKSEQRFSGGYFRQERAYVAIMALIKLGRVEEARAEAARFHALYPKLPYGARIERALATPR